VSLYISIAISAWVLYGVASVLDKVLLDERTKSPVLYAFYTGIFALVTFFLFASFAPIISLKHFLLDLLCGAIFLAAQYCLFRAIAGGDVSRVVPVTGALTPVLSLIFVSAWLHVWLTGAQYVAFALLVIGTFLVQFRPHVRATLLWPLLASVCFAVYYTVASAALSPFIENIAYVSLGSLFAATLLLFVPEVRRSLSAFRASTSQTTSVLFLVKEAFVVIAALLLSYSVSVGNPAISSALQGVEYVTIFFIVLVASKFFPKMLREGFRRKVLAQELVAILLILAGLLVLRF
jgi:glucose uptake protein GlcU